jgi:hypothetical protein
MEESPFPSPNYSLLEEDRSQCVDREVSLEERGTELTASPPCLVLGKPLALFPRVHSKTQFAGRYKAKAHCLALEGSPLDRPLRRE